MTPGDKDDLDEDVGGDAESSSTEELSLTSLSTTETPNVSPVIGGFSRMPLGVMRPDFSAYHAALMSSGAAGFPFHLFSQPFTGQYHSLVGGGLWPPVPSLGLLPPTYFPLGVLPKLTPPPPITRVQSVTKKEPRSTLITPILPTVRMVPH